jgi:hypothetical protein
LAAFSSTQLGRLLLGAVLAFVCLAGLQLAGTIELTRFLGAAAPLPLAALILTAGLCALVYLQRTENLLLCSASAGRSRFRAAAVLALPFAIAVTVVDVLHPFPADINVALPAALLFYPAIGFVAQMAMHIVPFALLVLAGRVISGGRIRAWWLWASMLLASTIEASFQAAGALGGPPLVVAYLATSLFLFGFVELYLYRRFDYLTMFIFRMLYYGYWHIGWGGLRLLPGFPAGT